MYKAAIFDMDGTLTNTLEDLADSVNEMLEHYNLPRRTIDEVRIFVGNGARKLMERALATNDEKFINEALEYYNGCYSRHLLNKTKPYSGIVELLTALNEKNIPVAICTNKQHFAAVELAKKIFPTINFAEVIGDAKKPNPARALEIMEKIGVKPAEVAYFGDTAVDMQTAINAGFLPVGVTWGFRPESELQESGAKIIIHSADEIFNVIDFGG
jgi:phosphoglycolate phosphatase